MKGDQLHDEIHENPKSLKTGLPSWLLFVFSCLRGEALLFQVKQADKRDLNDTGFRLAAE
jgi:hypothetical protein